jgi:pilus assembly protein CpaE
MADHPGTTAPLQTRTTAPSVQAFIQDRDSEGVIRQSLSSLGVADAELITGDIETAISTLAQAPSPKLLIVDVSGIADPISRISALADVCEPNTGVVVIGDRNDIVLYRSLKHAGVVEYLFKPLVSDLMTRTCNSVLTGSPGQTGSRTGKLVFVLGVRGGVGATTVAVNTAWYLAETRQRWVMLLDLDTQNGDGALQLDAAPSHALREALEHPERVDKLFLERAVIHVDHRIDLLASLEPLGDPVAFEESAFLSLLDNVLHRYRFVFVDLPVAVAPQLIKALHLPSICVLVSNGTLVSAREAARWRAYIGPNSPERTTLHLLNQHGAPGSLSDAEFARAAGQPADMVVPYDREIAASSVLGTKGTQKIAALRQGLAPLLRHLSGEQIARAPSLLTRLFG